MLPYIAGSHRLAVEFDGSFLIGFICKEIPHNSRSSLGIESRNPHVPTCCHLRSVYLPALNPIADLFNWRGPDLLLIVWFAHDRGFIGPILVLFIFVLVIIFIVRISRRGRGARDGEYLLDATCPLL